MFGHSGYPVLETVIVNTKTARAFRGVLWAKRRDHLVLRNAELLKRGEAVPIDGDVLIERANVDFIQVLARGIEL